MGENLGKDGQFSKLSVALGEELKCKENNLLFGLFSRISQGLYSHVGDIDLMMVDGPR